MTTNRPFLGGLLAAFRVQPVLQKAATAQSVAASAYTHGATSPQSQGHDTTTPNTPSTTVTRTITTKARPSSPGPATVSVQSTGHFQPTRQHAPPYNRSTSPKAQAAAYPIPGASHRNRRGSDSSSEGFYEAMGTEKWYIGGRTATGEDKYYKLGMVKRHRSADRLSLDKLSI